jgi:hypothetical protein
MRWTKFRDLRTRLPVAQQTFSLSQTILAIVPQCCDSGAAAHGRGNAEHIRI